MANKLPIDQVDAALVEIGKVSIPAIYGSAMDVASISSSDFEGTDLVLRLPSVRIRFNAAQYASSKDPQMLTYRGGLLFSVMCAAENLRSELDERMDTLKLLNAAQECFVGARLKLQNGTWTDPIELVSVEPMMIDDGIIDGFYVITIRVPGFAQFGGPNANFGAKA